ncbi:hypothetical protein C8J57DRAFT_1732191, partial [Mycena rebaudengoi]
MKRIFLVTCANNACADFIHASPGRNAGSSKCSAVDSNPLPRLYITQRLRGVNNVSASLPPSFSGVGSVRRLSTGSDN